MRFETHTNRNDTHTKTYHSERKRQEETFDAAAALLCTVAVDEKTNTLEQVALKLSTTSLV